MDIGSQKASIGSSGIYENLSRPRRIPPTIHSLNTSHNPPTDHATARRRQVPHPSGRSSMYRPGRSGRVTSRSAAPSEGFEYVIGQRRLLGNPTYLRPTRRPARHRPDHHRRRRSRGGGHGPRLRRVRTGPVGARRHRQRPGRRARLGYHRCGNVGRGGGGPPCFRPHVPHPPGWQARSTQQGTPP